MQPGSPIDTRAKFKRKRPPSGLKGWAGAWSILEHVERDDHLELLSRLTRESGFQGGAALKHMASCLCFEAGVRDYGTPPAALKGPDVQAVQQRAEALIDPYRHVFPKARRPRDERYDANGV